MHESLQTYGEEYHRRLSPYGSYGSIFEAVKYTKLWYHAWLQYVDQHLVRLKGEQKRALDVGCGMGALLSLLQERGFASYGLDRSQYILSRLRQAIDADVVACDIQRSIPFNIGFDLITCFEVLEHLEQPERALAHMYAALGAEGSVCISTPFPSARARRDPTHINLNIPDVWQNMLTEVGFSNVVVTPIWCAPLIWRIGRYWSRAFPGGVRWSTSVLFTATK